MKGAFLSDIHANTPALETAHWRYLKALPETLFLTLDGIYLSVVHGSPQSDKDYIFPSITEKGLFAKLNSEHPALLVCGHSHIPFMKLLQPIRIVNCGACGLSIDCYSRPSFALVDINLHTPPRKTGPAAVSSGSNMTSRGLPMS